MTWAGGNRVDDETRLISRTLWAENRWYLLTEGQCYIGK